MSIFPRKDFTRKEWKEWSIIMAVFAITGSSSVKLTRPVVDAVTAVKGSWKEGPNSWRIAYLLTTLPIYSTLLLTFGTIAGQRVFFTAMVKKMWSRFLPR